MAATSDSPRFRARPPIALAVAAACGTVHALFSFYWAAGGTFLVASLGSRLVESFRGLEWLLAPVGLVKLVAAVAPLWWASRGWPLRRLTYAACWLGAAVLIVWGGANTVVGNLVLTGVIRPQGGYDRPGMIGHAYLWDPLFVAWGLALTLGLIRCRSGEQGGDPTDTASGACVT